MLQHHRLLGILTVLSLLSLAACSSGGATGDESSEGALEERPAGAPAPASETLLRCNVFEGGGGPDQEVTVKRSGDALTLIELTNHGSTVSRALEQSEWESRVIKLRQEYPGEVNTLTKEGRSWRNESRSSGFNTFGYADCDIDKTN
jgi:hypothetical protein